MSTRYPITKRPLADDFVPAAPGFGDRACLAVAHGAVGDCIRPKGHDGFHQGAFGWSWDPEPDPAPVPCGGEHVYRDFDGSWASMPCGADSTRKVTTRSPFVADMVESEGGWNAYRAHVIHDGEADPGEDPGYEAWGDSTEALCPLHYGLAVEEADQADDPYGYTIIADTATN